MAQKRMKLGEMLLDAGLIDAKQLDMALAHQRSRGGGRLGATLVRLECLTEEELLNFLSAQMKLPRIDLSRRSIPEDLLAYMPAEKAWEFHALPVDLKEMHGTLFLLVAMADPTNLDVIDALQFMTGCQVRTALAFDSAVEEALVRFYGPNPADSAAGSLAPQAEAFTGAKPTPSGRPPLETSEERMQELLKILLEKGILSLREYERLK